MLCRQCHFADVARDHDGALDDGKRCVESGRDRVMHEPFAQTDAQFARHDFDRVGRFERLRARRQDAFAQMQPAFARRRSARRGDLFEDAGEHRWPQRLAKEREFGGLAHERAERLAEIAVLSVPRRELRLGDAPDALRRAHDRSSADGELFLIALSERPAGEKTRGGGEISVVERAQIASQDRDFFELAGGGGDGRAGVREGDHTVPSDLIRMVNAFILMNVERSHLKSIADDLLAIPGIAEVYSVAGPFDIVAIARVRHHDDLNDLVTEHVAALEGIEQTETLIAFKTFAKKDLGMLWDIGVD